MIGGVIQKANASATAPLVVQRAVTGVDASGQRTLALSGTYNLTTPQGISLAYDGAGNRRTAAATTPVCAPMMPAAIDPEKRSLSAVHMGT